MEQIKFSKKLAIISITIITVIFLAIISPIKGLSILTGPLMLLGIVLWVTSIIQLIAALSNRQGKSDQKKRIVIITIILIIAFIPLGFFYVKISGNIRTTITVNITNTSKYVPNNILIYGAGNIFENPDTLKLNKFNQGEKIEYIISPTTIPHRNGNIRMEFDIDNIHISKVIAGEFSINPYSIQQEWEVIIDNEFIK